MVRSRSTAVDCAAKISGRDASEPLVEFRNREVGGFGAVNIRAPQDSISIFKVTETRYWKINEMDQFPGRALTSRWSP